MSITKLVIDRPVIVRMVLILIIILGIYSYRSMPRYNNPDITIGEAFILTVVPGFSPEEVEKLVTNKIEDKLRGISEINRFKSLSIEGTSDIDISFHPDLTEEEIDAGMQKIRNAVDLVDDLPAEARTPMVMEVDMAFIPICQVGLYGDLPMMHLQDIAEDVARSLENIDGVSEVRIQGKREKEIWVELNPRRMSAYNVSISEVARAVSARSRNLPGGTIEMGHHETAIRLLGEPGRPEDLSRLALRSNEGGTVYLGDIARVTNTLESPSVQSFIDNKNSLTLDVRRKKGVNIIRLADDVKASVERMREQYPGLRANILFDQSNGIKRNISKLQTNAFLGITAVFIILGIAIGIRNAVYASAGMIVAFLITFTIMKLFGLAIDSVTLLGLILVLGIIVDDAIVVLENVFRHVEAGEPLKKAALEGAREVMGPVIASVSTNMAAFFPILLVVGGIIGRFMDGLCLVVIFALSASLFEVFFMLPSHVVELTPQKAVRKAASGRRNWDVFRPLRRIYYPYLRCILRHRYISVLVIILSTGIAFFLYFQTDFEMFPKTDAYPRFNIHYDLPVGSTLDRTRNILMDLNDLVKDRLGDDLDVLVGMAGMKEVGYEPIRGAHYGMLTVILKEKEERSKSIADLLEGIRDEVEGFLRSRGVTALALERLLEGPEVGADVDLKIQSPDWETSAEISRLIREELGRHKGIVDITDNFSRQKKYMEITVDEVKAKGLGIDQDQLVMAVQAAFYGLPVATYHMGEEEQDIRLKYLPEFRKDFDDLMNMDLALPGLGSIPLKEVSHIRMRPGFNEIYHFKGEPTVRVTANIRTTQDGERMTSVKANSIARDFFERLKADFPRARMIAGGVQEETETSMAQMRNAAFLALFLIFFILAVQFNSFLQPLIIMITIPFITLGVMTGLLVSNNPLTFITLVGLLALAGIVVNDSLVLIDFINRYRKEHPGEIYLAILKACHVRLRPILLTSLTTIFGLAPMALGLGGKSLFWSPLATAVMWGLGFSTILILSMVPAYYLILEDIRYLVRHRKRRKLDTRRAIDAAFMSKEIGPYVHN